MIVDFNKVTIGADPEYFASYKYNDKYFVEPPVIFRKEFNADSFIAENDFEARHPIFIKKDDILIMEDGAAFEYTLPPVKTPKQMYEILDKADGLLSNFLKRYGYEFYNKPVINFDLERFNPEKIDDDLWMCMIFGCDEDYDALDDNYKCEIAEVTSHPFRYGGGHIHYGSKEEDISKTISEYFKPLVQISAICVGNTAIKNSKNPELEIQRGNYYGKAGRYRIQPHGLEYRSPSNSWTSDKDSIEKIFNAIEKTFEIFNNPKLGKEIINNYLESTVKAIRFADQNLSETILNEVGL
ncbi:MAG: hypothetical protein BV457_08455 [Thermoplasmata archaeon M9B1D]|nr:MAG: hypothetical protein BV457_08455 [Thermoplasmata archaeon M9B1D]